MIVATVLAAGMAWAGVVWFEPGSVPWVLAVTPAVILLVGALLRDAPRAARRAPAPELRPAPHAGVRHEPSGWIVGRPPRPAIAAVVSLDEWRDRPRRRVA